MPNDPSQTSSSPTQVNPNDPSQQDNTPQTWIAYHNSLIIGFFNDQASATQALQGYQMDNTIDLNDVLDVGQLI